MQRVEELKQWIGEHGKYWDDGRPLRPTAEAKDMLSFNMIVNSRALQTVKMLERGYM